jgi:hypothetical protein
LTEGNSFQNILGAIRTRIHTATQEPAAQPYQQADLGANSLESCPCCGMALISCTNQSELITHNPRTCELLNLVLAEFDFSLEQQIRVEIYPGAGPLRGYYSTSDPYAIHISEEAYLRYPEYIIFHETKHLVDCLTKGWSEEGTPDKFARDLCLKYGYNPPPLHAGLMTQPGIWSAGATWY